MQQILSQLNTPLFDGIAPEDRVSMLHCIGYYVASFRKGEIVAFEAERIRHVGVVISGSVDMIKEDVWGNKTMLLRIGKDAVFGETFACSGIQNRLVSFVAAEDSVVLFAPFRRVISSCASFAILNTGCGANFSPYLVVSHTVVSVSLSICSFAISRLRIAEANDITCISSARLYVLLARSWRTISFL